MSVLAVEKSLLYTRLSTALKQRIEAGEWGYGAMLPSEHELCEVYNVSRGTVRQAMAELEAEGLVRRERGRGTFLAHSGIQTIPKLNHQSTISFIVPYVRDSFIPSILLGLESIARHNGCSVVFNHVENDLSQQDEALRKALSQGLDSIVLYPVSSQEAGPVLRDLAARRFPLVIVDRTIHGLQSDAVTSDNFGGGVIATQHLLSLGHRHVAFLSWIEPATSMEYRRLGYRQALQEAGLPNDPALEWEVVGYPDIDQTALEQRLLQTGRPTAIFAANDQLAMAVLRAARAARLSIPDDLALVGFDNLDISAQLDIPLTTIAQPAFEIGRVAGELVLMRLSQEMHYIQKRILPVQLIVRRSCGAI